MKYVYVINIKPLTVNNAYITIIKKKHGYPPKGSCKYCQAFPIRNLKPSHKEYKSSLIKEYELTDASKRRNPPHFNNYKLTFISYLKEETIFTKKKQIRKANDASGILKLAEDAYFSYLKESEIPVDDSMVSDITSKKRISKDGKDSLVLIVEEGDFASD